MSRIVQQCEAVYREALAELQPEDRDVVAGVRLVVKARPDAIDLERGCTPHHRACFFGFARELAQPGVCELPDPAPASGEITLFLDNLVPLTKERVRIACLHELAHALGYDEQEIQDQGLMLPDGGGLC